MNGAVGFFAGFIGFLMRIRKCSRSVTLLLATLICFSPPVVTIQADEPRSSATTAKASATTVRSPEEVTTPVQGALCKMGEWPSSDVRCGESKTITKPVLQDGYNDGEPCAPETKIVTGPPCKGCGDGKVRDGEQCDGDPRSSSLPKPPSVPPAVWGLRWCDKLECIIKLPDYCGDGKLNGKDECDWASAPGTPGYNSGCTRECTFCVEADSCGRKCGDANYGQRNCCAGAPMPKDAMVKKECKFRSESSAGRGCYEGEPKVYAHETRTDSKGRVKKDKDGNDKLYPLYTTTYCAFTGAEFVNGTPTGQLCDYWMDYLPDSYECRNKKEECKQVGVENRTGPVEVTTVSCKTGELITAANCNPATEWNCLEQTKWTCKADQQSLETLWNRGEACEKGTSGCIAITYTVEGATKRWEKTETSYQKQCGQQLVGAATGCRYAHRGGKRVLLGCDTLSEGAWTPERCSEWTPTGTTQQSGEEYIPKNSTSTKYVRAVEPLCTRTVVRGYATNNQCETTVTEETRTYEVKVKECKQVGDLYFKGRATREHCSGTSAPGDIGLTQAEDRGLTLNNLFVKQCVQGNLEVPADGKLDRANPWSLLNIEVKNQGYSLLGKYYASAIEKTDVSGVEVGRDPLTQEICWTCAWIRYIGCFDPETVITLADKTSKKVRDLSVGDEVFNPITKRASKVKDILESAEQKGMVLIEAGALNLKVTQGHPVYIATKGNIVASALKVGDKMVSADGSEVLITKVETLAPDSSQKVINFTLEGGESFDDHMLIANGLLSGDLFVQKQLNQHKK